MGSPVARAWLGRACIVAAGVFVVYLLAQRDLELDSKLQQPSPASNHVGEPELGTRQGVVPGAPPGPTPRVARSELRVVDIFTGSLTAGVPLELTLEPGPGLPPRIEIVESDAGGLVSVGSSRVVSIRASRPDWRVADVPPVRDASELLETIYVCRQIEIRGRIVFEGLEAGQPHPPAAMDWRRILVPTGEEEKSVALGSTAWLIRYGLQRASERDTFAIDEAGMFHGRVPLLDGLHLTAHAEGWRSAAVNLDAEAQRIASEGSGLVLVMTRSVRIAGSLVDERGRLIRGEWVYLYLTIEKTATNDDQSAAEIQASGLVVRLTDRSSGESHITVSHMVKTTEDGRFSFDVPLGPRYRASVVATPSGFTPLTQILGGVSDTLPDVELRATEIANGVPRIKILRSAMPVSSTGLVTLTLITPAFSHSVSVLPDTNGTVDASSLEVGRMYAISVFGELPDTPGRGARKMLEYGYLVWDGRGVVEMGGLDKNYSQPR